MNSSCKLYFLEYIIGKISITKHYLNQRDKLVIVIAYNWLIINVQDYFKHNT